MMLTQEFSDLDAILAYREACRSLGVEAAPIIRYGVAGDGENRFRYREGREGAPVVVWRVAFKDDNGRARVTLEDDSACDVTIPTGLPFVRSRKPPVSAAARIAAAVLA